MISAIKGKLFEAVPGETHVDTGTGWIVKVLTPVASFSRIKESGDVLLYTVFRQKEDEVFLYGFLSKKERKLFEKMIAISGIGGKTALAFISAFTIEDFVRAVDDGDVGKLSSVPGIGKKTAQRLVLELTGKLEFEEDHEAPEQVTLRSDLESGLENLGYPIKSVRDIVAKTIKELPEETSFENLFKAAIKKISKR
jgi:Holliday junction DNA helicase RuvA